MHLWFSSNIIHMILHNDNTYIGSDPKLIQFAILAQTVAPGQFRKKTGVSLFIVILPQNTSPGSCSLPLGATLFAAVYLEGCPCHWPPRSFFTSIYPFLHLQPHVATPSSQTMVPKASLGYDSSDQNLMSILASDLHPGAHWLWRQPGVADADGEFTLFTSTFTWRTLTFVDFGVASLRAEGQHERSKLNNQCFYWNIR